MGKLQKVGDRPIVELVCNKEGYYKILDNGTHVTLTRQEWREELTKCIHKTKSVRTSLTELTPTFGYTTQELHKGAKPQLQRVGKLQKVGDTRKKLQRVGS